MKAVEFSVVGEARRAAHGKMRFFNAMLAAKNASNTAPRCQAGIQAKKIAVGSAPARK